MWAPKKKRFFFCSACNYFHRWSVINSEKCNRKRIKLNTYYADNWSVIYYRTMPCSVALPQRLFFMGSIVSFSENGHYFSHEKI